MAGVMGLHKCDSRLAAAYALPLVFTRAPPARLSISSTSSTAETARWESLARQTPSLALVGEPSTLTQRDAATRKPPLPAARLPPSELVPDIAMRTSLDDLNPHPNPLDRYMFCPFF